MAANEPNTVSVPGKGMSFALRGPQPISSRVPTTVLTTLLDCSAAKKLLSNEPLRKPNRTRPIDRPCEP